MLPSFQFCLSRYINRSSYCGKSSFEFDLSNAWQSCHTMNFYRILDAFHLIFIVHCIYYYLVTHFANIGALTEIVWSFKVSFSCSFCYHIDKLVQLQIVFDVGRVSWTLIRLKCAPHRSPSSMGYNCKYDVQYHIQCNTSWFYSLYAHRIWTGICSLIYGVDTQFMDLVNKGRSRVLPITAVGFL